MTAYVTTFVPVAPIYPLGTINVAYPHGTVQLTFDDPLPAVLILNNNDRYEEEGDKFDILYGASFITITNKTEAKWPVGTRGLLQVATPEEEGGIGPPGPPGADSGSVDGIVALRALSPVAGKTLHLNYHTNVGDLGGGQFYGVTTGGPYTDNDGTVIVPTGGDGSIAWLRVVGPGPLYASYYNVVGNASLSGSGIWSGTDAEPKIKDALYRHVYGLKGSPAELPIGNIFVGRGLHVGYGASFQYGHLRGAGRAYNYQNYPATTLVWNFTDEPLISIAGARGTIVEDVSFSGPGRQYLLNANIGAIAYDGAAGDDTLLATWVDPAWPAQASSRYAPAAVIAVDPRFGPPSPSSPTSRYRDVDYPAAMGAVPQYNNGARSSGVTIRDFNIYGGGMVAVVVHPNEASDGNGDFVRVRDANITWIPVGLSVGQTQARLTLLDSVDFARIHTAITTKMHGMQNGVFVEARNCHFGGIQIFDFQDTSIAGHITINGYGEEMWRIGDVASPTSASTKLVLHQLKLSFELQSPPSVRGVPATMIGGGAGNVVPLEINGGSWTNYVGCVVIDKPVVGVHINGLVLQPWPPTTMQHKCFMNGTAGGLVFPQLGTSYPIENIHPKFTMWHLDTGAADNSRLVGNVWPSDRAFCTPLWVQRHCAWRRRDEGVRIPERVDAAIAGSTFTSPTFSGLTLTTTWGGRSDMDYMIRGPMPGDIMYHTISRSVFVCMTADIATDVVTFQLLNNYRGDLTPRNPINFVTDNLTYIAPMRWYSPASPIYGVITSGSPVITDAGSVPDGGGAQVGTLMPVDIAVGDWVVVDDSLKPYLEQWYSRITAIDGAAKTITLSHALAAIGSSIKPGLTAGAAPLPMRVRLGTFCRVIAAISSALAVSGTVGVAFSYQITAQATSPGAATVTPTSFTATPLPAGLTVNTSTGAITGTPTTAGVTTVAISAVTSTGTATANLVITVA